MKSKPELALGGGFRMDMIESVYFASRVATFRPSHAPPNVPLGGSVQCTFLPWFMTRHHGGYLEVVEANCLPWKC